MRELVSNSTKLTTEHSALPGVKRPRFPVKNIHKSALSRSRALKKKKTKLPFPFALPETGEKGRAPKRKGRIIWSYYIKITRY